MFQKFASTCNIAIIYEYVKCTYTDVLNIHMHKNPKNTRNTDDSLGSGTKILLHSWLLGFQHEERHNFYSADCSIWPDNARRTP